MRRPEITVQIMAGGRSSRMGQDKALVRLAGCTLLERAVGTWSGWGGALFVSVGGAERTGLAPAGTRPICDQYLQCGPLGGLQAGLTLCRTPLLLLCAVDTPLLGPDLAEGLTDALGDADACVYTLDGRPQPLFGLYRMTCLPAVNEMLRTGAHRMTELLTRVETRALPAPAPACFRNLNTPEDVRELEKEIYNIIE